MCLKLFYCRKTPFFIEPIKLSVPRLLICFCFRHTLRFHEWVSCVYSVNSKSTELQRPPPFETGAGGGVSANLSCQKKQSSKCVVIFFKACEDWVEGSGDGIFGLSRRTGEGSGLEGILRLMWWRNQLLKVLHSEKVGCADHREVVFLIQWLTWIRLKLSPDAVPLIYTSGEEHFVCFWAIPPC